MKYTLTALALAAVTVAAPTNQAPDSFKITKVVSGGSGCPQGSIDINWTDNGILPICKLPLRLFTQLHTNHHIQTSTSNSPLASVREKSQKTHERTARSTSVWSSPPVSLSPSSAQTTLVGATLTVV
jgi:hypothetical protein